MGKASMTRAGAQGNMNTGKLKETAFGVFAYHTPESSSRYTYWNTVTSETNADFLTSNYTSAIAANFMFNQKVEWNSAAADYVTGDGTEGWYYTPVKYWPNEIGNNGTKGVDDQENDENANPAFGYANNGNVSFFAYAPYVDFSTTATTGINHTGTPTGTEYGIVAINTKTTLSGTGGANEETTDPILTYKVNQANPVDLLWGTKGNTSPNVNGEEPTSYYTKQATAGVPSIYPVNVNLTKQRTNGVVDFAFKHALASLGGGSDVSSGVGFQVMLDIDDFKGAESGGEREKFNINSSGSDNAWRTIVTIKSIEVSNDLNKDGDADDTSEGEVKLAQQGKLNLATGEWTWEDSDLGVVKQIIGDPGVTTPDAELNTKIAENKETSKTWLDDLGSSDKADYFKFEDGSSNKVTEDETGTHPGVTEKVQNVYNKADQSPILFIPGQKPVLRVTVDYIVRTYDKNLKDKCTTVEQVISKKIAFPTAFEINKHYNLIMHLGLTGVKFTASVDSWDEGYIADNDGDLTLESSDIYLPRNVGGLMLTFSTAVANAASALTSAAAVGAISAAKYYIDGTVKNPDASTLTYQYSEDGGAYGSIPSWLTNSSGTFTIAETQDNTTFTDRTVAVIAKSGEVTSNPFTITQYGNTATQVQVTYSPDPSVLTTEQENTASGSATDLTTNLTIKAKGYETDATGNATSTEVALKVLDATYDIYEFVFIDDVTGKVADWITMSNAGKSVALTAQVVSDPAKPARTATMYVKLNGKLVSVVDGTGKAIQIKQKAGATS